MSSEASPRALDEAPPGSRQRRDGPARAGRVSAVWPAAACVVAGLALYVTRGVLDQAVTAGGVVRFAMLPPWQALVGFICLAALVLVGVDHLNAPRGTTTAKRARLRELVLPMFALAILLLPFL